MTKLWSRSDSSGRELRRAVCDCLGQLGRSPDEVAARLQSYGVQGLPGKADDCPLARYLRAVIGTEHSVAKIGVLERRLRVSRRGLRLSFSLPLPPAIQGFIRDFDEGNHPALVAPPVKTSIRRMA